MQCASGGCSSSRLTHKTRRCSDCSRQVETIAKERRNASKRVARASMTEDERLTELASSKRRRSQSANNPHVSAVLAQVKGLREVKQRVLKLSQSNLSSSALLQTVCCVCDCLHPSKDVKKLDVNRNSKLMASISARLKAPPNLPEAIIKCYDVTDRIAGLDGVLLSRDGVGGTNTRRIIQICTSCRSSLMSKNRVHPPKFAIANGLYIGRLPSQFQDSTMTENAMLNLSQPMHYLTVVRGGKHTSLRSHAYFFRADPAPPASLLPRDVVSSGLVGVTMVGALTSAQRAKTMKQYNVRVDRLRDQLDWYLQNNRLYDSVELVPGWQEGFSSIQTRVVVDDSDTGDGTDSETDPARPVDNHQQTAAESLPGLPTVNEAFRGTRELDNATWRHNAPIPAHVAVSEADEVCEQASVGFLTNYQPVDTTTGVQQVLDRKRVVVFRSSAILSDFDPGFWSTSFCELFPFGRGSLDEPRPVPISLHEFVRYCLRLSSRAYAQHRSFSLVAFDVIARHNALQAIYLKARMSPVSMEQAGQVTRNALEAYVQYQQSRMRAVRSMDVPVQPPVVDERLRTMFDSISTGMRAFWGSNDERTNDRADLFSMQLQFGQPTMFFTLSPDSSSSFQIGLLSGDIPASVLGAMETGVRDCLGLTRARLGQIATSNPASCAKYFDIVMSVFVNVILSWDGERGCARPQPGLFGRTKAFYAATESQSSTGSLHSHMLIWIDEMPSTVAKYYELCTLESFRTAMVKYVDAIISANVPLNLQCCTLCGSEAIQSVPLQRTAFRKPRPGAKCPATVRCRVCSESFGADQLILGHIEKVEALAGVSRTSTDVFWDVASTSQLPAEPEESSQQAAILARSLLFYQHHHWFHSKSCFKATKRTPKGDVCRMFIPREPCAKTQWSTDNRIELKRNAGNEYLNPFVPVVNAVFKCNHDVKLLGAGEGPEKAYYMMKYATKPQKDIENPWALHLHAFDKAEQHEEQREDPVAVGRRRVQSICCTLSNAHEVSAPMASLYLLRGSSVYSSHKFVKLNITAVLSALFKRGEDVEIRLEADDNECNFTASGVWQDYMLRPLDLNELNLMTFVQNWERKKSKSGLRFSTSHPLHTTHTLYCRSDARVVVVRHKRLPDLRNDSVSSSEKLRFRQTVLALFHPFRHQDDLSPKNESFDDFFQRWWDGAAPEAARTYVSNNTDYYESRDLAKNRSDPDVTRYCNYPGIDGQDDGLIIDTSDSEDDEDDTQGFEHGDPGKVVGATVIQTKYVPMLEKAFPAADLAASSTIEARGGQTVVAMSADDVKRMMEVQVSSSHPVDSLEVPANQGLLPDIPTHIRHLDRAIEGSEEPVQHDLPIDSSLPLLNVEYPTLREVSSACRLNQKQHKMFATIGTKLLESLLVPQRSIPQMIAFLGGLPGAGKSRVIAALQILSSKWRSPDAVRTAAY